MWNGKNVIPYINPWNCLAASWVMLRVCVFCCGELPARADHKYMNQFGVMQNEHPQLRQVVARLMPRLVGGKTGGVEKLVSSLQAQGCRY
jgi:hypothetical protein